METQGAVTNSQTSEPATGARPPSSASKVRVTYFECKRPLTLPSPEASDAEWEDTNTMTTAEPLITSHQHQAHPHFITRQISTESGQDNPFRPDGDLSREADELVELLKGGRPISEILKGKEESLKDQEQQQATNAGGELGSSPQRNPSDPSSPTKSGATNGSVSDKGSKMKGATEVDGGGSVEVQRGVVPVPSAVEGQVEHVVIKKKSKGCCVIQ